MSVFTVSLNLMFCFNTVSVHSDIPVSYDRLHLSLTMFNETYCEFLPAGTNEASHPPVMYPQICCCGNSTEQVQGR